MNWGNNFDLYLFHRDIDFDLCCIDAGIDGLIIDLETRGKPERQMGFDTEINNHAIEDIYALKSRSSAKILCRINPLSTETEYELDTVLDSGADEIIVPMIHSLHQAEEIVERTAGRCDITLMVETREALHIVEDMCALPIHQLYVGLNDLAISRQSASIFLPLIDGQLDAIRISAMGTRLGFGGLTLPGSGNPLATSQLINEMARLDCAFSFLRRSFYRDIVGLEPASELSRLRAALTHAHSRQNSVIVSDRNSLQNEVEKIIGR